MDKHHLPERPPSYEGGQDIRDRAFDYACRVVGFCRQLSDGGGVGRLMVPQLLSEESQAVEEQHEFLIHNS